MKKRLFNLPTLKDVAALASVSSPIVSRVLTGDPNVRVSPETRDRIVVAARTLNYRPNALARSLKVRRTFTLALFIPDVGNPVFPEIVHGVEEEASERGYSVSIRHLDARSIRKKLYLTLLQESRVDGLILATARTEDSIVDELVQLNCPFVLLNRRASTTNNHVTVDDTLGSKLAVDHLVDLGHRRIGHLSGPLVYDTALRRLQGYRQSLAQHGLPHDASLVEETVSGSYEDGKMALARLLQRVSCPTAIFAYNFMVATGAMAFLREHGLNVPGDVSIIGLHDAPLAELLAPPLTVVRMPLLEMGRTAARALIDFLSDDVPIIPRTLPPLGLVVRESTAPPPV